MTREPMAYVFTLDGVRHVKLTEDCDFAEVANGTPLYGPATSGPVQGFYHPLACVGCQDHCPVVRDLKGADRLAAVLAELELMASEDYTEEAAQADRRWHQWAMRQAGICHGGNGSLTVASAIREAHRIVDERLVLTAPSPSTQGPK